MKKLAIKIALSFLFCSISALVYARPEDNGNIKIETRLVNGGNNDKIIKTQESAQNEEGKILTLTFKEMPNIDEKVIEINLMCFLSALQKYYNKEKDNDNKLQNFKNIQVSKNKNNVVANFEVIIPNEKKVMMENFINQLKGNDVENAKNNMNEIIDKEMKNVNTNAIISQYKNKKASSKKVTMFENKDNFFKDFESLSDFGSFGEYFKKINKVFKNSFMGEDIFSNKDIFSSNGEPNIAEEINKIENKIKSQSMDNDKKEEILETLENTKNRVEKIENRNIENIKVSSESVKSLINNITKIDSGGSFKRLQSSFQKTEELQKN